MYTLAGTKNVDFKGSDGVQVNGMNLYFTYEDPEVDGEATDRVFISSTRFMNLTFMPEIGSQCETRYNKYGRVADIVLA